MKKKLLIATTNEGKFKEIMEVVGDLPFEFVTPKDLGLKTDADESGETYEENALIKAQYYFDQCGVLTLAEDSGIVVDALKDELGVHTRRWGAGEKATDEEWIMHFLDKMEDVPDYLRTARFICCAAVISLDGESKIFVGETGGVITCDLEVPIMPGLPLSSCFRPNGFKEVYAALTVDKKNQVSHRGKAMRQVYRHLASKAGVEAE